MGDVSLQNRKHLSKQLCNREDLFLCVHCKALLSKPVAASLWITRKDLAKLKNSVWLGRIFKVEEVGCENVDRIYLAQDWVQ
jgi:hypothetical protein